MVISDLHPWNVTYKEAVKIQNNLKGKVSLKKIDKRVEYVAGIDVSYAKGSDIMWAGVVVLDFPSLQKAEERWAQKQVSFPYIPGLLSFREIPALIEAVKQLEIEPDLIFCDGQGIAHPRGFGLASHLGIILNTSTIGCAKSPLVGTYNEVGESKGSHVYLIHHNRIIGAVVRTRSKVKPIFVSPGYGVILNDCVKFVLKTCSKYRIPEPTRQAHLLVNSVRSMKSSGLV
jgi:deoxyribonuclease V